MYKPKDIVAVFGESLSDKVIKKNHKRILGELGQMNNAFEFDPSPAIAEVVQVIQYPNNEIGVVVKNPEDQEVLFVSSKQLRLIERDGKKILPKQTKYLCQFDDGDQVFYNMSKTMQRAIDDTFQEAGYDDDNYDSFKDNATLYKAIEIDSW
jgi:hypothetical protein